jgi:SAM-dependent methyltransferase
MVPMSATTTDAAEIAARLDVKGLRVLDVGCGAGAMVRRLRFLGAEALGVECGAVMLSAALAADPDHAGDYLDGVAEDLPVPDESVDVVCFFRSLHHVPVASMAVALTEAHRVLRPGGVLYVVEPAASGPNFELSRLVDDETEVRAMARKALDDVGSIGLTTDEDASYTTRSVYSDIAAWEAHVVGIDPSRAEALEANRDAVESAFHELGLPVDGGLAFDQPQHLVFIRKLSQAPGRKANDE